MAMDVSDILMSADLFRRAYPNWPHPEPEEAPVTPTPKTGDKVLVQIPGRTDLRPVVVARVSPSGESFEALDGYRYAVPLSPVSGTAEAA